MIFSHSKYMPTFEVIVIVVLLVLAAVLIFKFLSKNNASDSLEWERSSLASDFRKKVESYCIKNGWKIIPSAFKIIDADFYIEKNKTKLIIVCIDPFFEGTGAGRSLRRVLSSRVIHTKQRFSDPVLYLFQESLDDVETLRDRGLIVLPYTALPEIMNIALHGTVKNTTEGSWQRALIRRLPARCRAVSEMYEAEGELQQAIEWAALATEAAPKLARETTRLAELQLKVGDLAQAEVAIRKSIELAPATPGPLWLMATIKDRQGEKRSAFDYAERWVNIRSEQAGAHKFLINLYVKYKEYDKAFSAAKTAATMLPSDRDIQDILVKIESRLMNNS